MTKKVEFVIGIIVATIVTLGLIAAGAGWIAWAIYEREAIIVLWCIGWILGSVAIAIKMWYKTLA